MNSFIILRNEKRREIPREFIGEDVRYPECLVEYFIGRFTIEGDYVLDPFAGFGTTLICAEKMGRIGYGVEFLKKRADHIKGSIHNKNNIICGDSFLIDKYGLPMFDLCMFSPPYLAINDKEDPLKGYTCPGRGYYEYLRDMERIFSKIKKLMRSNSHTIVEVSNMKGNKVTPLAFDMAHVLSKVMHFEGEIVIGWEGKESPSGGKYSYGYDHSYCLVFKN